MKPTLNNLAVLKENDTDEKVPVTQRIFDTITDIRDSGETNMFDYKTVQYFANERECFSTVCWIQNNVGLYSKGITHGFKVIEEVKDEQE